MKTLATLLIVLALPASVSAAAAPSKREEAAARFDRALGLLDDRDDAGALAELKQAFDLVPATLTQLMIGFVHASMNQPVEAIRNLDLALVRSAELNPAQVAEGRKRRAEMATRVAFLRVDTNVAASIEVDGLEVARTPSPEPIPVAQGSRLVAAVCAGYLPVRKQITLAGRTTEALRFELAPTDRRLAHVMVRTNVPDAEILIDGEPVGATPLVSSVTVPPGERVIEVRRTGYPPQRRAISLGDGATGELSFELEELASASVPRGRLILAVSESEPELTVDGVPRGVYRGPVTLPAGRHFVRVLRGGFVPGDRLVKIEPNGETEVRVTLAPTPEHRLEYVEGARSARRWGWASAVGGTLVAAAGAVFATTSASSLSDARSVRDQVRATFAPPGTCDPAGGGNHFMCEAALAQANDEVGAKLRQRNLGLAVLGVGTAAAVVGAYLLITGDDPGRYDTPRTRSWPQLELTAVPDLQGAGLRLAGRF